MIEWNSKEEQVEEGKGEICKEEEEGGGGTDLSIKIQG